MTSLRKLLVPAVLTSALVVAGCGSSSKTSTDTASTTTEATTTTVAVEVTATAATTTAPPTTAAPAVTSAPTTAAPAPTGPEIVKYSIPAPQCPGQNGLTVTWEVTGADTVYFAIDGPGVYEYVGPSGSMVLPFTCGDTQEYFLVAVKDGQQVIRSKTRP